MKFKLICLMMLILTIIGIRFPAGAQEEELPDLETKVALESGLEKRLRTILAEITGTDKITISVNVHLYNKKERKTLKQTEKEPQEPENQMILPGVPMKDTLGKRSKPILAPLTYEENKTMIKGISANVFLDSHVSDEMMSMVERVTKALLGIDPARGDELVIERIPFGSWNIDWKRMVQPPDVYWVAAILLGISGWMFGVLFLFGPFRRFFIQLVNSIESLAEKSSAQESSAQAQSIMRTTDIFNQTNAGDKSNEDEKHKKPFSFIKDINLNDLVYMCRKEQPEMIAIIVSYLNPALASRFLNVLGRDVQERVSQELSQIKERPAELVLALEKKVKEKIDFMIGGEDRLQQIINFSDSRLQMSMVESLKASNPEFAGRIKKLIFSFEDMINLDGNTIQMLIRNINPAIFAQVLKSMPDDFKNKILHALPPGLMERLQEEMELGKPLSAKRIEEEKRVIVQLIKNFEQQGLIELGK
ncbi:MAG: FliG C-terminal domain-containing protein [bacterium]